MSILAKLNSRSIKVNYLLNFLRVFSAALVGIYTLPYLTRILGPAYMGKVEYINSIINYFILFSSLGIPMYGIREISKQRNNTRELYKTVAELYAILSVTTVIAYIILFGVLLQINALQNYHSLILIMSGMVILNNIGAEWFFQGMENQLYITVRYVVVRVLVFALIYVLIKQPSDYLIYAALLVLLNYGANILNFAYLSRKIYSQKLSFSSLEFKKHLKPILTIFIATVSVNIYLQLDNFLIGSISGDQYVGYYAIANKLIRFVISFITIIGAVLLPRLSFLFVNNTEQYYQYLQKCFNILVLLSIPASIFFFVFANTLVHIMAGKEFESSIVTMRILSPLCIIVSMAYFMGFLILYPQNREKIYTYATVISAVFSIMINYFAIQKFQQNGAAVIAILSEFFAIVVMYIYARKNNLVFNIFNKNTFKVLAVNSIILLLSCFMIGSRVLNLGNFLLFTLVFFTIYVFSLILVKEDILQESLLKLKTKYQKKKHDHL